MSHSTMYKFGSTWLCEHCLGLVLSRCDTPFLARMMSLPTDTSGNLADRLTQTVEVGA